MRYHQLGHSDLSISAIGLGTMTWGEQNSETEAHAQLDYALSQGINFIDSAEMYPVPPKQTTQGSTERYIGTWINKRNKRDDFILATKAAGPGRDMDYLRGGPLFNAPQLNQAVDDSLRRLQTDYIDLYQLHWPERPANYFGKLGYAHKDTPISTSILETLQALATLVQTGKIRYIGISNETPWGVMQYLQLAQQHNLPKIVSIQNPYNLINRSFEIGLAEMSHRENLPLLAYSPLAFGLLSGKYAQGKKPANARLTLFNRFQRYNNAQGHEAAAAYTALAQENNLTPVQMALAYVISRPFVASTLVGATALTQLAENISSLNVVLSTELLNAIDTIHIRYPNPCP
ncbi:MAG: NADP(H)-dependent aldo-keto reductase [Gammaproteobacteria bacterium]|nr:NADP(H)-dependent aldo-keto reductase [Gammaproteobacteria bacterium]